MSTLIHGHSSRTILQRIDVVVMWRLRENRHFSNSLMAPTWFQHTLRIMSLVVVRASDAKERTQHDSALREESSSSVCCHASREQLGRTLWCNVDCVSLP